MTSLGFHFGALSSITGQRTQDLQQLAQQREPDASGINSERNRGLIGFTGRSVVITPAELLFDPNLNDSDRIYWCALRLMCQEGSNSVNIMPDQNELAERLGKTRYMIIVYNKMLRATRWITQVEALRQNNIPTRYSYAIHEHPIDLEEVLLIDSEYKDFIQKEAIREKNAPRLSQYCQRIVKQLGIKDSSIVSLPHIDNIVPAVEFIQQPDIENTAAAVEFIQQAESPAVDFIQQAESPAVEFIQQAERPAVEFIQQAERPAVEFTQQAESPAVEFIQQAESSAVEFIQQAESPAVDFIQQAESPAVEFIQQRDDSLLETGDIYKRARDAQADPLRAGAPTQIGINKIKDFINTHPSIQGRGYGGREGLEGTDGNPSPPTSESPFAWLHEAPFSRLIPALEEKFGRKGTHALFNRIKLGEYRFRDQPFRYRADPDDAAVILVSLLDRDVKSPLAFIDGLLWRAAQGELIWQEGQLLHWRRLTGEKNKPTEQTGILPDGTWLEGISGTRYCIEDGTIWSVAAWEALQNGAAARGEPIPESADKRDGLNTVGINLIRDCMHLLVAGKLRVIDRGQE
ncbi:hypothetical protein [Suttonella indologenes]|uniref:ATP synthase archaeal, H subunit n=1 Tax=Suttonella indologenes TaxID=13276 RepID=A0A380MJ12_9GAMM|nr:hypothetical protein [Suttonella indologenes]SUO90222.1 ATP synthase archaeal, H subunit [Suttonella indologenes]